jgi:hypothetical protein
MDFGRLSLDLISGWHSVEHGLSQHSQGHFQGFAQKRFARGKCAPQGLKPGSICGTCGAAEAAPFQNSLAQGPRTKGQQRSEQ